MHLSHFFTTTKNCGSDELGMIGK